MIVEIIAVGTEILLGNIINTNAQYLAQQLAKLGYQVHFQVAVGDDASHLEQSIKVARKRADMIILTGGLGPTQDDLTKEIVAKIFEKELYLDKESKFRIQEFFRLRNIILTDNNWKQAMIPEGATVLANDNGTAPGVILEEKSTSVILLPGPPNELMPMFQKDVIPYLVSKNDTTIHSHTLRLCGIGESQVETMILDLIQTQTNPRIATYAKVGQVDIIITAMAQNCEQAMVLIEPIVGLMRERFGEFLYSENDKESIETVLIGLLKEKNMTLSVAESCTAGLLAATLVNVSGASDVLNAGFIVYANEAKEEILDISKEELQQFGAVSECIAINMAKAAASKAKTDCSIGITGIAGPNGGTKEKPVGLVYIACKYKDIIKVHKCNFHGNRQKIRNTAVVYAMIYMRELLN